VSQLERLQALLTRIQKNAADLAESRANGAYAAVVAAQEPAPDEAVATQSAQASEPAQVSEPAPAFEPAPAPVDDQLDAELAASETSGTWAEPPDESAAESYEERTGPRTPPPESGPQMAPQAQPAAQQSEPVELDEEMELEEFDEVRPLSERGHEPSMEQLGSTVELEPATSGALEMAMPEPSAPGTHGTDELEEDLPLGERAGVYDESLRPPPTVADDLAAVDRAERERRVRLSIVPEVTMSMAPDTIAVPPSDGPDAETTVLLRSPVPRAMAPATFEARSQVTSQSFLQLLDDALRLGG
jgi:hypothetical protein